MAQVENLEWIAQSYLILTLKRPKGFRFNAGQYLNIQLSDSAESPERSYSIASPPERKEILQLCIQIFQDGMPSAFFRNLKKADLLPISSAQGQFKLVDVQKPMVFIAGGSGISPFRSLIHSLLERSHAGNPIQLIYGCREISLIPFREEFLSLQEVHKNRFQIIFTIDAESSTHTINTDAGGRAKIVVGNPVDILSSREYMINLASHYYLCGPPLMVERLQALLISKGIASNQILLAT